MAVTRHATQLDASGPWGVAELQWPPKWEFPLAAALSSVALAALAVILPSKPRSFAVTDGVWDDLRLGPGRFGHDQSSEGLRLPGLWGYLGSEPGLRHGLGALRLFPGVSWLQIDEDRKPLCGEECSFERPSKTGDYGSLVLGATFFGLGWGMVGICPGPALAGMIPYLVGGWGPGLSFGLCVLLILASWLVTDRIISYLNSQPAPEQKVPANESA